MTFGWAVFLAVGALASAGCGSEEKTATNRDEAGNPTDRAFVEAMVPHHRSAVAMAKIARKRGTSQFVRQLADDIILTQNDEIATLRLEDEDLETAGVKRGNTAWPSIRWAWTTTRRC